MHRSQVEDKELDANKVHTAMAGLIASQTADREAQRLRYITRVKCLNLQASHAGTACDYAVSAGTRN